MPLKVSWTAAWEKNARSWSDAATPSTNTSEVSLMSSTNSLVSGGIITRKAWGMMMLRIDWRAAHAERAGGFHLALGHRLDAAADGLGEVGAGDDGRGRPRACRSCRGTAAAP